MKQAWHLKVGETFLYDHMRNTWLVVQRVNQLDTGCVTIETACGWTLILQGTEHYKVA